MNPTASRRTTSPCMTSTFHPAATRALIQAMMELTARLMNTLIVIIVAGTALCLGATHVSAQGADPNAPVGTTPRILADIEANRKIADKKLEAALQKATHAIETSEVVGPGLRADGDPRSQGFANRLAALPRETVRFSLRLLLRRDWLNGSARGRHLGIRAPAY